MGFYTFEFVAPVERHEFKNFGYTCVYFPGSMEDELKLRDNPRLRVEWEVAEFELNSAVQPSDEGWYLTLPQRVLKATGIALGDEVRVRLRVADQAKVDVPEELLKGLATDKAASATWQDLTPGKKRSFAWRVSSAKRPETKNKRLKRVLDELSGRRKPKKQRGRFG